MEVSEALRCVEDGESGIIGITLAAEVKRLEAMVVYDCRHPGVCPDVLQWIPVADRKPSDGKPVLIHCITEQLKRPIVLRAVWYDRYTEEAGDDEFEAGEYCEEKDEYFVREGWYEFNQYEGVHWAVGEEVTHWAEIPLPPVEWHNGFS
jgi:hypothetical protein